MPTDKRIIYSTIAFQLTNTCNANCQMCCESSEPLSDVKLDIDIILKSIDAIKDIASVRVISVSGGEPFLYPEDVLSIAKRCKQVGRQFAITTNAFWCDSYSQTFSILSQLKENNLATCFVSADKFHQTFININCVKNLLRALRELNIPARIQVCLTKSTFADTDEIIKSIGEDKRNTMVIWGSICPVGRAKTHIDQEDFYTIKLEDPLCQYQRILRVSSDGRVQPCCSPCFTGIPFDYGNVYTDSLENILKMASENALMREIVNKGFERLVKEANDAFGFKKSEEYVNVCHLCNHLLSDPERCTFLMEKARNWRLKEDRTMSVIRSFQQQI